jgi:CRISPR-associated protein Csd2
VTNEKDLEKERTMGRKHILPYGLYRVHGFISAKLAERTGFSDDDLDLLWRSLVNLFEHDRSAARGEMSARKLIVFQHENAMGNAPAHVLFDTVKVERMDKESDAPARGFSDYRVIIDSERVPAGVSVTEVL